MARSVCFGPGLGDVSPGVLDSGRLQPTEPTMNLYQFLLLGAVSCALFWVFARRAGDKQLARMTAVAFALSCAATLILWELAW